MSRESKHEYFHLMYERYHQVASEDKTRLLDELCRICGWHRKHAIRKLNQPLREPRAHRRSPRGFTYSPRTLSLLSEV